LRISDEKRNHLLQDFLSQSDLVKNSNKTNNLGSIGNSKITNNQQR